MINKLDAIVSLIPNAEVVMVNDEITWINPKKPPVTEKQIQEELIRLTNQFENNEYQRLRSVEYPSIQEQLDTLFHGGYDVWKEQIQAVKDKYPKPE